MGELAADEIPVTVWWPVLKLSRQPYHRWLANPVSNCELTEAYRANALFAAHCGGPEHGYPLLTDEADDAGQGTSLQTAWRIYSTDGWFSRFDKRKPDKFGKPGPPVLEDLVSRDFTSGAANQLRLGNITENHTLEGKLDMCSIKDVFFNRIVGYSIDSQVKSHIGVNEVNNAVIRHSSAVGCIVYTDSGYLFRSRQQRESWPVMLWSDPWAASLLPKTTPR